MVKITVFDNGGKTFDRYTVHIGAVRGGNDAISYYIMSFNANGSNGVNMRADMPGNRGKKLPGIPVCILSAVFRRAIETIEMEGK